MGGAKPRMQRQCPCKIVLVVNCNANTIFLLAVDRHMCFFHSNPHQSLLKCVHLQGGSPSIFVYKCLWLSVHNRALTSSYFIVCVWISSGVRCSYSHWLQGCHLFLHYCDKWDMTKWWHFNVADDRPCLICETFPITSGQICMIVPSRQEMS